MFWKGFSGIGTCKPHQGQCYLLTPGSAEGTSAGPPSERVMDSLQLRGTEHWLPTLAWGSSSGPGQQSQVESGKFPWSLGSRDTSLKPELT